MAHALQLIGFAAFLLLQSEPGFAEDPSSTPNMDCKSIFDRLVAPSLELKNAIAGTMSAKGSQGCRFENVVAPTASMDFTIDAIDIDRVAFSTLEDLPIPETLRMSVTGIHVGVRNNPVYSYIMRATSPAWSILIDYNYDSRNKAIELNELSMNLDRGKFIASGSATGFSPMKGNLFPGANLFTMSLKSAKVAITDPDSSLQKSIAFTLGFALLDGSQDPAAKDAELRKQAESWMRANLPIFNLPDSTISSLVTIMRDFPRAIQPLKVDIDLATPVSVADLLPVLQGQRLGKELLPDGSIKVTYGE